MPSFDVLTIGSATQDIFLLSKQFEEIRDPHAPDGLDACVPLGAKIHVDDMIATTGGGATNAAVTFAHFGHRTACITRVGEDAAGETVVQELKSQGIATTFIQRDAKEKTATSMILVAGSGHRAILTHRGASRNLVSRDIPWSKLKAKWVYVTSLAGDMELLHDVFRWAHHEQVRVAWNPGNLELEHGLRELKPFLRATSVLILNREEAALLANLPPRHPDAIIKKLAAFPSTALIVTAGQNGAYLHAHVTTFFAPARNVKRINTTGAGDAFGSAFVGSLAAGRDMRSSLQTAMLNATGVITHMGAKAGILRRLPSLVQLRRIKVRATGV